MNGYFLLFISFLITISLSIPFIGFLYHLKFQTQNIRNEDIFGKKELFNKLHAHKTGTPTGGGLLILPVIIIGFIAVTKISNSSFNPQFYAILLTLILFWLIGLYDDSQKILKLERKGFFGLRKQYKLLIQVISGVLIGSYLFYSGLNSIAIPFLGNIVLGPLYIIYAALFITFLSNCFNITDGLDGLSAGIYLILCFPLIMISRSIVINHYLFVSAGAVLAYLYFNVKPARYYYGDTGALPLGAVLGTITLLTDTSILSTILYMIIITEGLSSLIQWTSKILRKGKKVFLIAPFHHHMEALGWDESKIVIRFWLVQIVLSITFLSLVKSFV